MLARDEIVLQRWYCEDCGLDNSLSYPSVWDAGLVKAAVVKLHAHQEPGCKGAERGKVRFCDRDAARREE